MRLLLYTGSFFVFVGALLCASYPAESVEAFRQQSLSPVRLPLVRLADRLFYQKDIEIAGVSLLPRPDVEMALPLEKSIFWWWANQSQVLSGIRQHSLVKSASLDRCESFSLSCFKISIEERSPSMIALVGQQAWVVDDRGGFITPIALRDVARTKLRLNSDTVIQPPIVRGLHRKGSSPDKIKARFDYVRTAIETIRAESGLEPRDVAFQTNGELQIRFRNLPFPVQFDSTVDDQERLVSESRRLKKLVEEFRGKEQGIEKIDLAFDKVAVVKLRE